MESKFNFTSYLVLALICGFAYVAFLIIPGFFNDPYYDDKLFPKIFIPSLVFFSFIYLVFGELRTKIIIIKIQPNEIIIKRFFGLKTEVYKNSEINGWVISYLTAQGGTYEYLYLKKGKRKVIKISQFYHKNYFQLKKEIKGKFKDLGYEKFSFIDEFKEIFI